MANEARTTDRRTAATVIVIVNLKRRITPGPLKPTLFIIAALVYFKIMSNLLLE